MKRRIGMAALLLALLPATLPAQYFGRNKVQYGRFDFKIIQTEHFDVYYYPAEREAALDIARMAERSYAKLSKALNHEFNERKPIIPYASHSDFQQTNTSGGEIDESTGGFTDYLRHRNIFPLTGSYEDDQHVLQHEMTHQFQFDIWSRGRVGGGVQGIITANAPLWFGEGMAEYFSLGPVDPNTAMWLRDAALEGKLPGPEDFYRVFPYRFGQALVAYIGGRWGDEAIGQITKLGSSGGIEAALQRVLGLSFPALVAQWQDAVQKQYLPEIGNRVKARAIATELLTKKASGGTWHLAPALSPDGTKIAYLSEKNFYFVDLWLADGNTGQTIHRLLSSSASGNFETFRYITSSASFSADGKYLALTAQRNGKDDIVIVDVERNKQIRDIRGAARRRQHADLEPRRHPAGVQRAGRRHLGPLRDQRRRHRTAAAHQRQGRRPASGLVAGRQVDRVYHRSRAQHRFRQAQVGQPPDRDLPPGLRPDRPARRHERGPQHQSPVVARRAVDRVRLRTGTGSPTSSCTTCPTGRPTSSPISTPECRASRRCHRCCPGPARPTSSRSCTSSRGATTSTR